VIDAHKYEPKVAQLFHIAGVDIDRVRPDTKMHGGVHAREVGHLGLAEVSEGGGAGGAKSVLRLEILVVEDVDFMHWRLGHLVQHKGASTVDA